MKRNVTNWDEQIKHLIPDLEAMFKQTLFSNAEKAILNMLGVPTNLLGVINKQTLAELRQGLLEKKYNLKGGLR